MQDRRGIELASCGEKVDREDRACGDGGADEADAGADDGGSIAAECG